jgi:cytochrome c oxidase subunit 1
VASILWGRKVDASNAAQSLGPMPKKVVHDSVATYGSAGTWHLPGTYALVGVFFTAFVLYYFVNWKYLSELWPMQ